MDGMSELLVPHPAQTECVFCSTRCGSDRTDLVYEPAIQIMGGHGVIDGPCPWNFAYKSSGKLKPLAPPSQPSVAC